MNYVSANYLQIDRNHFSFVMHDKYKSNKSAARFRCMTSAVQITYSMHFDILMTIFVYFSIKIHVET